jgi:glutamate synthase domain-containing protein 1
LTAVKAIESVRFRGSSLGAGFAYFDIPDGKAPPIRIKIFVDSPETLHYVRSTLLSYAKGSRLIILGEETPIFDHKGGFKVYEVRAEASPHTLQSIVDQINIRLFDEGGVRGRIFSYGRYVNVFKGVGYPHDVAEEYGLNTHRYEADLWLAHTRQPTNSPGTTPVWSHPFSANEVAVVHNGDISSYGSNLQLLRLAGYLSFVGTDSEVIAFMLDYLLRVKGYSLRQALLILQNPYEYTVSTSNIRDEVKLLMAEARGCQLDGPFTVVAGYCDGRDVYLLALVDRAKFRPIIFGEDDRAYYVASEECQIRCVSPSATVWTPEPSGLFVASLSRGLMQDGSSIL